MHHSCNPLIFNCSSTSDNSESDYDFVIEEGTSEMNNHHLIPSRSEEGEDHVTIVAAAGSNSSCDNDERRSDTDSQGTDGDSENEYSMEQLKEILGSANANNNVIPPEDSVMEHPVPPVIEERKVPPEDAKTELNKKQMPFCLDTAFSLPTDLKQTWSIWGLVMVLIPVYLSLSCSFWGSSERHRPEPFGANDPAMMTEAAPNVVQDLSSFVAYERASTQIDGQSIEEFPTDSFRRYAVAMCSAAPSFDAAKKNLRLQLSVVPEEVSSKVMDLVLVEGISQKNSIQDATSELETEGHAQSYMAFWSTTYNPKSPTKKYETCFVLAGIAIKVADIVAGYKEETKEVIIGSEPCKCGYITSCETCPVLTQVTARTPVFKRHSLTLQQQDELHRWMTIHALKSAESMLATTGSHSNNKFISNKSVPVDSVFVAEEEVIQNLAWRKPDLEFLDNESEPSNENFL